MQSNVEMKPETLTDGKHVPDQKGGTDTTAWVLESDGAWKLIALHIEHIFMTCSKLWNEMGGAQIK